MTLLCGLIGLPPINGVLPQSPMHTKALAKVEGRRNSKQQVHAEKQQQGKQQEEKTAAEARAPGGPTAPPPTDVSSVGSVAAVQLVGRGVRPSPSTQELLRPVRANSNSSLGQGTEDAAADESGETVPVHVYEQRVSGLLQSLGVGACLAAMPAIRQIPTAVLWGESPAGAS